MGPLMIGLQGRALLAQERDWLAHPLVGGVVLFGRNYQSPEQIAALTAEIHAVREPPLLVAVDHEGGRVQRFRDGFTRLPAVRRLGEIYDQDRRHALLLAQVTGWLMAAELRAVGVDFSFAPVLDVDRGVSRVIGDRALHRDPEAVAELAHAYMTGMQRAGMAATGKHFPGHGGVREDSHVALPVDERAYEDVATEDLVPFERMIHYGLAAVMTAHVVYPRVDARPASFSAYWIKEVLRRRLEFQGAVFSDDLDMAAAAVAGDPVDRARAALEVGCDMVLACNDAQGIAQILDGLGAYSNPVAQVRLARMHGRHSLSRDQLQRDPEWQQAVRQVQEYDSASQLDMDM